MAVAAAAAGGGGGGGGGGGSAAATAAVAAMTLGGASVGPSNPTMAQLNAERAARVRAAEATSPIPNLTLNLTPTLTLT